MEILTLQDIPDLKCDSCITNDKELIFMSLWGRETSMQELLAKLTIGEKNKLGLTNIKFDGHQVVLSNEQQYTKRILKVRTIFGTLIHTFIFDMRIIEPDRDSNSMICLYAKEIMPNERFERYFHAIKTLTSVPILEHWADKVVDIAKQMIHEHKPIVGNISATTITVNDITLTQTMSHLIKNGTLTLGA